MARVEPFYQRVRDSIEEKIKSGFYKHGEYLPSESKLEAYYKVSRTTIRNAVQDLVDDGYLIIVRGKGTKVTSSKLSPRLPSLVSFTDIVKQQGLKPSMPYIKVQQIYPAEDIAKKLDITTDEKVYEIYRVRAVDDEPITIHHSYIPGKYIENFNVSVLKEKQSLYRMLEEDYNIIIQMSEDNISAILADTQVAKALSIEKGYPILKIEKVAYDQNNNKVEYGQTFYRGDRWSQSIIMRKNF
ncbi:MAG: GntR family transcriptional regulator [Clostridiaceae bacterium]